jgi:hypothetical protein
MINNTYIILVNRKLQFRGAEGANAPSLIWNFSKEGRENFLPLL